MAAKLHSPTHWHSHTSKQIQWRGKKGVMKKGRGFWRKVGRESDIANSWMSTTLAERTPLAKLKMKGTRPATKEKR